MFKVWEWLDHVHDSTSLAYEESGQARLPGLGEGPGDAYRHILGAAELTRRIGPYGARAVLYCKEVFDRWLPVWTPEQEAMDHWNNKIGVEIGLTAQSWEEVVRRAREKIVCDPEGRPVPGYATWIDFSWTTTEGFPTWWPHGDLMPIRLDLLRIRPIPEGNWSESGESSDLSLWSCSSPLAGPFQCFIAASVIGLLFPRRDPLILDLDNDGIETTNLSHLTFFDHNGDGFAEQTGWVSADDGLLVMDRNSDGAINDGRELFGDQTLLQTGTRAANGFQALAELDSNHDGKIDETDMGFSRLRVWQDLNENGLTSASELRTLEELGITSIDLNSAPDSTTDPQGNTRTRSGVFDTVEGASRQIAEYSLQRDTVFSFAKEWLDVPENLASLPDLSGYGTVYDLHQAMVRDSSGQLRSLVEQFIGEGDIAARNSIMEQILFKWTGTESIDPQSRGPNIDARKLAVLEKFFAQSFVGSNGPNPSYAASVNLNEGYRQIFELTYSELMSQTHLKSLYDNLVYTWDEEQEAPKTDFRDVIPDIVGELNTNPVQGKQVLSEFARSLRGISSCSPACYLAFREHMLEIDPELGWVFDTGGLPVYQHRGQGIRTWSPHIEGTDNADAVRGSLSEGDGALNGLNGNDVIYGTSRNEWLFNESGDAVLVGGGGNDIVVAGAGDDILDGGEGDDQLLGEAGNDTYIFRRGSGQDTIIDRDATPDNMDTIWLGSNLTPEDIILRRAGDNLVLKIISITDTLTVQDFFRDESTLNRIERIQFMDGTVWTDSDMILETYTPTEGDDIIYGTSGNDALSGLGGSDTVYGLTGDDTLHGDEGSDKLYGGPGDDIMAGGAGNDILHGGNESNYWRYQDNPNGNDTYLFGRGSGQDIVYDYDSTAGNMDTIELAEGILPADIELVLIGNDLELTIIDTQDTITVKDWLQGDTPHFGVEAIRFADGAVWDSDAIQDIFITGTEGNDIIYGFSRADTIQGAGGDDRIYARGGNDILDGGTGSDRIYGEAGNDTLTGGDGNDTLQGGVGDDLLAGATGADTLWGEEGFDTLLGGEGDDSLNGGRGGDDIINGRPYGIHAQAA